MTSAYIATHRSGELADRVARAKQLLRECTLCPRACAVDRTAGELGTCELGAAAEVASAGPHFGEEAPLVGQGGSGTIFLSSCNLRCVFCQNYDTSQGPRRRPLASESFAAMMLELQHSGCHNINFVTPSHQVPAILEALGHAIDEGLTVPLVYNTSGYDAVETLRLLEGVVDIYMPDLKTLDPKCAEIYLRAPDYPEVVRAALREMHRQVGDLAVDARGVATRGILLRHLVMPSGLADTRAALTFLHDEISPNTYVNIMAQYRPAGETARFTAIDRAVTTTEYKEALEIADEVGMRRLDQRLPKYFLRWL